MTPTEYVIGITVQSTKGDGECGTFLSTGGALYGPWTVPCYYDRGRPNSCAGATPARHFDVVDQQGVTGQGLPGDPFRIVTVVDVGDSGLRITQTDSYLMGEERYRTDVQVTNMGDGAADALLTRAGDCWLQGNDHGRGRYTPETAPRPA